jgi:hypothetical protein
MFIETCSLNIHASMSASHVCCVSFRFSGYFFVYSSYPCVLYIPLLLSSMFLSSQYHYLNTKYEASFLSNTVPLPVFSDSGFSDPLEAHRILELCINPSLAKQRSRGFMRGERGGI